MKIGFFDSGIGGLTVLGEAIKRLPTHEYLYYADTYHAPYGPKPKEEVREYVMQAVEFLVREGAEMVVIACNTATSIAATELRQMYSIPIIGMEPAVKPALECVEKSQKRVLVTATPLTLKEEKLKQLIQRLDVHQQTDLLPLPDLVCFAEAGEFSDEVVLPYLTKALQPYQLAAYGAVVLGCTHFPLFIHQFEKFFSSEVQLIDGSHGTVSYLEKLMIEREGQPSLKPSVTFYRSGELVDQSEEINYFTHILNHLKRS
ncbi:MAG: glutamate racemase [Turicibacter sp.]|nr:glutamate racemase [Turicibacter sp.]